MENTKIRIECTDGEIKEYEGKAVIGIIMDTDECEDGAIDRGFLVGRGNRKKMLLKAAMSLGELVRQAIDDEFDQIMVAGAMTKILLKAAAGESKYYEVVSAEHKEHVAEEEED